MDVTRFEYLSVLVSIVLALGIAEVTVSWGRILQNRDRVRFSWLHAFWSVLIFLLMIEYWWGFWNFRTVESWSLFFLVVVVTETITLVLCAILLTPGRSLSAGIDLEQLYYKSARPLFFLLAVLFAQFIVGDTVVLGNPVFHIENIVRMVAVGLAASMGLISNRRVHVALPVVAVSLFTVFILNALVV